ncbi:MAG TPA: hypothetical protein VHO72_12240 [Bacteroidales bacterium]|nr:hypothetical protein [Bacteroidales bacterium]
MDEKSFKCRIEELPFLATFIMVSFNRDKTDFIAFSQDYNDPFAAGVQTQITTVEDLIAPKKLTGELKSLTRRLKDGFMRTRNFLNKVERYLDKAAQSGLTLTMAPDDFGIKKVRDAVNLKNDEGAVLSLRTLQQNLADNLSALVTKGYTDDVQAELKALIKDLNDASVAQTLKKKERETLVKNNIGVLNTLWATIDDLMKTGKAIYKEKDSSKVKDYTYANIIKDVQLKRKQQEEDNTVATAS